MFRKLRNKFLTLNMLVTSLVMLTAFAVVYISAYNNAAADIDRKLDNVSASFVIGGQGEFGRGGLEPPGAGPSGESGLVTSHRINSDYVPSFVITTDKAGNIIGIDSLLDLPADQYTYAARLAREGGKAPEIEFAGRSWMFRIAPVQITHVIGGEQLSESADQYQITFLDITDIKSSLNNLLVTLSFVGAGMLAVIFLISLIYANRSIRPISEAWEKQKQFVADASHELKTPLTTIMTNCDVLEANGEETINSQKEWLDHIKIGADRMSKLVNSLLTLARIEGMGVQAERKPFNVSTLILDIMQSMEAAAAAKHLNTKSDIDFDGEVYGYEDSVRQVLTILYDNAIKYTDEGGSIEISARRARKSVVCSVRNTGKPIPPGELPLVFNRFYRADSARSSGENSYGLGLSIAKSITEQLGGKISVKTTENKWTEFRFSFDSVPG